MLSSPSSSSSPLVPTSTPTASATRRGSKAFVFTSAVLILSFLIYTAVSFRWIIESTSPNQLKLSPNLHSVNRAPEEAEELAALVEKDADDIEVDEEDKNGDNDYEHLSHEGTPMDQDESEPQIFDDSQQRQQANNDKVEFQPMMMMMTKTTAIDAKMSKSSRKLAQKSLVTLMDHTYLSSYSFLDWTRVLLLMTCAPLAVGLTIALAFVNLFGGEGRNRKQKNRRERAGVDNDDDSYISNDYDDEDDYEESDLEEMEERKRAWQSRKEKLLQS